MCTDRGIRHRCVAQLLEHIQVLGLHLNQENSRLVPFQVPQFLGIFINRLSVGKCQVRPGRGRRLSGPAWHIFGGSTYVAWHAGKLHLWSCNLLGALERGISGRDLHSGFLVNSVYIHLILQTEYGCIYSLLGAGSLCYSAVEIVYGPPTGLVAQMSVACVGVPPMPA